jgi:hypothetical protein
LCKFGGISRAAYYKWLHRGIPKSETENKRIADIMEKIHEAYPDKGYRRIRDDLERYHDTKINVYYASVATETSNRRLSTLIMDVQGRLPIRNT